MKDESYQKAMEQIEMLRPAIEKMNRSERRRQETGNRIQPARGWTKHPGPKQKKQGTGWMRELDAAYRSPDGQFVIMTRTIRTEWGQVIHATITSHQEPTWSEKQWIKNQLFGPEAHAIEVFPKESQLVDEADMYHLWILPPGFEIPFTLKASEGGSDR